MFKNLAGPNRRLILAAMILGMVILSGCGESCEAEGPVPEVGTSTSSAETGDSTTIQTGDADGQNPVLELPDPPVQREELAELPWEADGLTDFEQVVQASLREINKVAPGAAISLADLPWMADEVTLEERLAIPALEQISAWDGDASRAIVDLPWLGDEVESGEVIVLDLLVAIAEEDPGMALTLAESPVLSRGVTPETHFTLLTIGDIAREDPALARDIAESPQIADGISGNELGAFTGSDDYYLERLAQQSPAAADALKGYPWATSDTSQGQTGPRGALLAMPPFQTASTPERLAKALIYFISRHDPALAERVAAFPWMADGVTVQETRALFGLEALAGRDVPLAHSLLELPWLEDDVTRYEAWAISRVGEIRASDETSANLLVNQPWFRDGLDGEDHALITVLKAGCNLASFCRQLIEDGEVVSTTLSFPSGEVRVFGVSRTPFGSISDVLFQNTRNAIPAISEMMGHPWAWPEVIVYHEPEMKYVSDIAGGFFVPTEPQFIGTIHAQIDFILYHELAHYYSVGPHWLVEGGAEFLATYTDHATTGSDLQQKFEELELRLPCNNAENIHQYVLATTWMPARSPAKDCSYTIGHHFLLALHLELGQEMVSGSLAELYRLGISGTEITEEVIYQTLLSNTPTGLEQQFRDLYQKLHGRPVGYQRPEATGDRAALIALFEATGGDNWKRHRYWLTDAPLGVWEGVDTSSRAPQQLAGIAAWQGEDRSGSVIGIYLADNGLTGTLPADLGALEELQELFVPLNNLAGSIPPELGELTELESLWLNENQFTGPIPPELGVCPTCGC